MRIEVPSTAASARSTVVVALSVAVMLAMISALCDRVPARRGARGVSRPSRARASTSLAGAIAALDARRDARDASLSDEDVRRAAHRAQGAARGRACRRTPPRSRFAGQLDANGDTEAGAMPARPRHCNGQLYARSTHATDRGREGEDARPGARRRPRPRHRSQVLGGGRWRHAARAMHDRPRPFRALSFSWRCPFVRSVSRCSRRASSSRCVLPLAACMRDAPRSAARASADDFGDTLLLARSAAAHRLAQPVDHRAALRASAPAIGSSAARRYDRWPESALAIPDLGPGLRPNVESVLAARPDLVLLYASDDNRDAARRLRAAGVATAAYRVDRIADFRAVTVALGALTGDSVAARAVVDSVGATIERVRAATAALAATDRRSGRCTTQPLLAIGGGSFLNELIDIAGGTQRLRLPPGSVAADHGRGPVQRDPDVDPRCARIARAVRRRSAMAGAARRA